MNGITGKIDVKDKKSSSVVINFDEVKGFEDGSHDWGGGEKDKLKLHIGGTNAVGDGELNDVIGGQFNINKRSNDFEKLLKELLIQEGNKDDGEVGISGVSISDLTCDTITISIDNGRGVDTMTFTGDYVKNVLADLASGIDAGDQNSRFNILDAEKFTIIGTSNGFGDIVGGSANQNDIDEILKAALDPSEGRIELISLGDDEFSVRLINGKIVDTFIFKNAETVIDSVIGELDNGFINTTNKSDEVVFIEEGETGVFGNPRGIDGAQSGGPNDIGGQININNRENDIETLLALEESNDIGDVTVTETADLAIIEIEGREGSVDTIIYEIA